MEMETRNEEVISEQPIGQTFVADLEKTSRNANAFDARLSELLDDCHKMKVRQEVDLLGSCCNDCCCCDKINKYAIKNNAGKTLMTAIEGIHEINQ